MPEEGKREATNPFPAGSGMLIDPRQPNFEAVEDRWGETPATWPVSFAMMIRDLDHNLHTGLGIPTPAQAGQNVRNWFIDQYNAQIDSVNRYNNSVVNPSRGW